jgi:hypothetical protein
MMRFVFATFIILGFCSLAMADDSKGLTAPCKQVEDLGLWNTGYYSLTYTGYNNDQFDLSFSSMPECVAEQKKFSKENLPSVVCGCRSHIDAVKSFATLGYKSGGYLSLSCYKVTGEGKWKWPELKEKQYDEGKYIGSKFPECAKGYKEFTKSDYYADMVNKVHPSNQQDVQTKPAPNPPAAAPAPSNPVSGQ